MFKKIETKRDVLTFLWEWAESKGEWAKLLLLEVLNTPEGLSDDTRKTIYRQFRKSIGLQEDIDDIKIEKPTAAFTGHNVWLKKLSNIHGLNRLSSDSVLEFSPKK
jgi:hypothetical protein